MNIGLLGGSFNPVHNAHLRIAAEAQRACALERVLFIPAADPPHKLIAGDVPFEQRAAMVALALTGMNDFALSTIEADRHGKSYSIDTIQLFREQYPLDELYFIIGGDSFVDLGSWHRYRDIFSSCNLIVVDRPGHRLDAPYQLLPDAVKSEFYLEAPGCLRHHSHHALHFVRGAPSPLSSTEIRRLAASGCDVSTVVPPAVAAYISQQRIYQCP